MRLVLSAQIAWLVAIQIQSTYGDQICHIKGDPICPENTCCSEKKCDTMKMHDNGYRFYCCEEGKDDPDDTRICAVCPKCGNNILLCFQIYVRYLQPFFVF